MRPVEGAKEKKEREREERRANGEIASGGGGVEGTEYSSGITTERQNKESGVEAEDGKCNRKLGKNGLGSTYVPQISENHGVARLIVSILVLTMRISYLLHDRMYRVISIVFLLTPSTSHILCCVFGLCSRSNPFQPPFVHRSCYLLFRDAPFFLPFLSFFLLFNGTKAKAIIGFALPEMSRNEHRTSFSLTLASFPALPSRPIDR